LILFVTLGLVWFFAKLLRKARSQELIPPARNALQLVLFAGATLVWLSLIGLSEGGVLDDLLCLWGIMVPAIVLGAALTYLIHRRRNLLLARRSRETDPDGPGD
jgi:hypothetical protein